MPWFLFRRGFYYASDDRVTVIHNLITTIYSKFNYTSIGYTNAESAFSKILDGIAPGTNDPII
jgi:hypothetical protein